MHSRMRVVGILIAVAGWPMAAIALGTIQNVAIDPTQPVPATADVTITTNFEMTSGVDGFTTSVNKTATSVAIDICVDVNFFTVISDETSVENVGTFSPGTVLGQIRLYELDTPGCGILRDTVFFDFEVSPSSVPALGAPAAALLVSSIVAAAGIALAARRRRA
jgi:hypothetical protein